MKSQLIAIVAAVLIVGCGESLQSAPLAESKPAEPVAEASQPEPQTAKAPVISIHKATERGDIEGVKQYLVSGVDVNAKDGGGGTPLHYAAYAGHKEIAELLIAKGADVNARGFFGSTTLHGAALYGHNEVVELLIANGADVNAKVVSGPNQGKTPLDRAIQIDQTETADLLRKHGGKTGEELKAEGK